MIFPILPGYEGADTSRCRSLRHPCKASRIIPNAKAARYSGVHRFRGYRTLQFSALCARRSPTTTASSLEPCSQRILIHLEGVITIHLKEETATEKDQVVQISAEGSRIGMSERDLDDLFQEFEQVTGEETRGDKTR